jgi:hypothetical protein
MVSPGLWNWTAFYPNYARAFPNIAALAAAGKRAGSLGCILSSWGDSGAESLRENNWTGYAYAAAASWEPDVPRASEFLPRFVATFYGVDSGALVDVERRLGWQDLAGVTTVGRVFHHALLVRPGNETWIARMTAMRDDMREAESRLAVAAGAIRDHRGHVAALRHGIRRFRYLAERELALDEIGRSLKGRSLGQLDARSRDRVLSELERLHQTVRTLAGEYPRLWLANNRPPASPYIADCLARQVAMLDRLCELARSGKLTTDESYSRMQAGAY